MSDKLFSKRKAKNAADLTRRSANRQPYDCALIVCEDSVSAPSYLRSMIKLYKLSTANIKIAGEKCGSDPLSVVDYTIDEVKARRKMAKKSGEPLYDRVFCVIDRDAHPNIDQAIDKAKQQKPPIDIILSVPCFEVWLLLHFCYSSASFTSANAAISKLKEYMPNYNKGGLSQEDTNILLANMDKVAFSNAKKLKHEHCSSGADDKFPNPITYMDDLILYLRDIKK